MNQSAPITQVSLQQLTSAAITARDAGQKLRAFELACIAATHADAGHVQFLLLGQVIGGIELNSFFPMGKRAIAAALDADDVEHQKFSAMWGANILLDPALQDRSALMSDPYVIEGLRKIVVSKVALENIFTDLRKFLLLEAYSTKILKTKDIPFLSALAEQCFTNEYVWDMTDEEIAAVSALPENDPIAVCLIGCYEPLYKKKIPPKLSAVAGYRQMMTRLVANPMRETELKENIQSISVKAGVSESVQAMYEENPYPRWISGNYSHLIYEDVRGKMLVAGCGTGWALTQAAHIFPNMDITAIDISKSSIAYAMRMAEGRGQENITFRQCDILALDALEERFDFIECSGVLHHLADPAAGWKRLADKLNDGGLMLISLYSTRVREVITEVREEAKKYTPDPKGIRGLRSHIKSLAEDHPLKPISTRRDFYAMSDIRDLVFHVQETTYTLLEIKSMMEALGLEFIGFKIPPLPEHAGERDLYKWHGLELQNPDRFYGMYEFLCKRKGETLNEIAQYIVHEVLKVK